MKSARSRRCRSSSIPASPESDAALDALRALLVAPGPLTKEEKSRVIRVEKVLGVKLVNAQARS